MRRIINNYKVKKIKFFTICSLLFLLVFGLISAVQQKTVLIPASADKLVNPIKNDEKATLAGARIYKKLCWTCHGDKGEGNGPGASEIKTKAADYRSAQVMNRSDGALFWWISNGGNDMQPYKEVLTKDEIWKTVNYVRKLQGK